MPIGVNFIRVAKCGESRDAEIIEYCVANKTFYKTEFSVSLCQTIEQVVDYTLRTRATITSEGMNILDAALKEKKEIDKKILALPEAPSLYKNGTYRVVGKPVSAKTPRGGTLFV